MAKILVVDDSTTLRLSFRRPLELAGHQVVEAEDGLDALAKLGPDGSSIDLILTDINMPRMDGILFSQKVKSDPQLKSIPIFIISTETDDALKAKAKEAGVIAWMTKPPNPQKLAETVAKILALHASKQN